MQLPISALVVAAAMLVGRGAVAQPIESRDPQSYDSSSSSGSYGNGGNAGLDQISSDHQRFVANPPLSEQPIPPAENNPAREAHRSVHAALYEATGT